MKLSEKQKQKPTTCIYIVSKLPQSCVLFYFLLLS